MNQSIEYVLLEFVRFLICAASGRKLAVDLALARDKFKELVTDDAAKTDKPANISDDADESSNDDDDDDDEEDEDDDEDDEEAKEGHDKAEKPASATLTSKTNATQKPRVSDATQGLTIFIRCVAFK